ncbi:hypothetical protein V8F44DRAFT_606390 [Aspergillus fumigatus]
MASILGASLKWNAVCCLLLGRFPLLCWMSFPVLQSACGICTGIPVSFGPSKPCNLVLDVHINQITEIGSTYDRCQWVVTRSNSCCGLCG